MGKPALLKKNLSCFILLLFAKSVPSQDKSKVKSAPAKDVSAQISTLIENSIQSGKKDSSAARQIFLEAVDKGGKANL